MKKTGMWNLTGFGKKWRLMLVTLFAAGLLLAGCGSSGSSDPGSLKDPYEAYGVKRGGGELGFTLMKNPPKVIAIQPVLLQKPYHDDASLALETMVFEKGKSQSFSFDLELRGQDGKAYPLRGTVTMKYEGKDSGDLFTIDTDAYGYATLVRKGLYSFEAGQHTVKGRSSSFTSFGNGSEEYLSFTLGVDKKDADKADGSLGIIFCKIVGVKR